MNADALLISGGRLLDLDLDLDRPPLLDVLVEGGRIQAIGPEATALAAERPGLSRLDATGKLVMPGLVNAHYHSHDVLLRGLYEQLPLDLWGLYSFPANYPRPEPQDVRLRTLLGAAECLQNGITTMQDMVTIVGPDREHADAVLAAYREAGPRVVLALQIADRAGIEAVPFWDEMPEAAAGRMRGAPDASGLRAMVEELVAQGGSERLTWALGPSAPQRCSDDLLAWVAGLSRAHGLQVFTHLYEARSQAVLARTAYPGGSLLDHLDRFGLVNPQLTIAHGVWISEAEIRRFGAAGAHLACNPMSNMKLLNGFAPVAAYAEAGAGLALGCDNCSGNDSQNLFQSMKMFALMWGFQNRAGETGAARAAFAAATLGGAKALGLQGQIGAIRPGYRADIVVVDLNGANYRPLNSAIRQLVYGESGAGIDTVLVEGRILVENGRFLPFADRDLQAEAEAARARQQGHVAAVNARNAEVLDDLLVAYEKAARFTLKLDRFSIRG